MESERYPLPFGWVKEFDQVTGNPFYVDITADPPRSISTHPYEDEEYLKVHPDVREKIDAGGFGSSESNLPPPSSSKPQATSTSPAKSSKRGDRGFLGKLKDKVIGTKEKREAKKKRKQEEDRVRMEALLQDIQQMVISRQQPQHGHGFMSGSPQYGSGHGSYGTPGGDTGMGLPLLGGFAGGLLLGDALNNYSGGGDFSGGDFGGSDFGGSDFGGGDFDGGDFGGGNFDDGDSDFGGGYGGF